MHWPRIVHVDRATVSVGVSPLDRGVPHIAPRPPPPPNSPPQDVERTRAVYEECLKVLPHRRFSFSKVWLLYAHFEVRQGDLPKARRILGTALGRAPKNKLYRQYIGALPPSVARGWAGQRPLLSLSPFPPFACGCEFG